MEMPKDIFPGIGSLSMVRGEETAGGRRRRKAISALGDNLRKDLFGLFIELFCQQPFCLKEVVEDLEKFIILNSLDKVGGNQKKAARDLGIKYTTLNEKIKRYNIQFQKSPVCSLWHFERQIDQTFPLPD